MDSDSGLPGGAAEALRQGPEDHARPSGEGGPTGARRRASAGCPRVWVRYVRGAGGDCRVGRDPRGPSRSSRAVRFHFDPCSSCSLCLRVSIWRVVCPLRFGARDAPGPPTLHRRDRSRRRGKKKGRRPDEPEAHARVPGDRSASPALCPGEGVSFLCLRDNTTQNRQWCQVGKKRRDGGRRELSSAPVLHAESSE